MENQIINTLFLLKDAGEFNDIEWSMINKAMQ
jgi:hypothetical protein